MKHLRNIFILISLLLAGCDSAPSRVDSTVTKPIERLAVVSLLGKEMEQGFVTSSGFGNKFKKVNVEHWRIDEKMPEIIQSLIGEKINVIPVRYDRMEFMKGYSGGFITSKDYDASRVKEAVRETASMAHADTVMIISDYEAVLGRSVYRRYGYKKSRLFGNQESYVWAVISIDLVDGKTQEPLASWGTVQFRSVPWEIGNIDQARVTNEELAELEKPTLSVIRSAISETLLYMGVIK